MHVRTKVALVPQSAASKKQSSVALSFIVTILTYALIFPGAVITTASNTENDKEQAAGPLSQDTGALTPDAPVAGELTGSQAHGYRLSLLGDQYVRLLVESKGILIRVRLQAPNGQVLFENPNSNSGRRRVRFSTITQVSGNYRLEVQSVDSEAKKGTYEVKVEELRAATTLDSKRVAGERVLAEGHSLRDAQTGESRRAALVKYQEALELFRAGEDRSQEASTHNDIGLLHRSLNEPDQAREHYKQALKISQDAGARRIEASTLLNLGVISRLSGANEQAVEHYQQALAICRTIGESECEAGALFNMGAVYYLLGEPQKAVEHYQPALLIFRKLGNQSAEATALNNVGLLHNSLGDYRGALEQYQAALTIFRKIQNRSGEADTLLNTALIYRFTGANQEALDAYNQALALFRRSSDRQREALALNNIGQLYYSLGESQKALSFFEQALQLARDAKAQSWIASALHNIGTIRLDGSNFQEALQHYSQALAIHRSLGTRRYEANALDAMGTAYRLKGEPKKALEQYDQALELHRAAGDRAGEATTLHNLGDVWSDLGDAEKAFEYYKSALELRQSIGDRNGEAESLYKLARLETQRGNHATARSRLEGALEIIESVRVGLASMDLRTSYLALKRDYYALYIDTLMQLHQRTPAAGYDALALQASERARARTLIETLADVRADIRQGAPAELLERERGLQRQINAVEGHRLQLLKGSATDQQLAATNRTLQNLLTQFQETRAQIRITSPFYAELTQPTPLSLDETQKMVLDPNTVMLEYLLGPERSFLFVVTPTALHSFVLPPRADIETAATTVYSLLTARNHQGPSETLEEHRARIGAADATYHKSAAALSQMVLGPAASLLGGKRLLIISEGALQYVPFAALPAPPTPGAPSTNTLVPLAADHEVISLPSASALAGLRRQIADRRPGPGLLAVFADPVFRSDDSRIVRRTLASPVSTSGSHAKPSVTSSGDERLSHNSGLANLVRLRHSRQEAEGIASFAPAASRFRALDFAASRETALSGQLGRYRIVHFATHGLLNSQHPELSGIVLSLVDEEGRPRDGFLRLHEIYNMKLDADLVVLSACQTALGQDVRGEGLIGLTRGFMYAGAARVVASLWQVDDRATAELMKRFYGEMLGQGQRPAAALRAAQISMMKEKRWESPYFWAAFTLQGEWR